MKRMLILMILTFKKDYDIEVKNFQNWEKYVGQSL